MTRTCHWPMARRCGLPRHHLIRAFRRETGLTPHAYLVDVRVRRARDRLRRGEMPGDVAAATGFCDQAHLTRAFKARLRRDSRRLPRGRMPAEQAPFEERPMSIARRCPRGLAATSGRPAGAAVPIGLLFGALAAGKGLSPLEVFSWGAGLCRRGAVRGGGALGDTGAYRRARFLDAADQCPPRADGRLACAQARGLQPLAEAARPLLHGRRELGSGREAGPHASAHAGLLVRDGRSLRRRLAGEPTLGASIGAVLGDPKRLGADFAFTALFIALVAAFWKGRVTFWTVAAAGIASAVTYRWPGLPGMSRRVRCADFGRVAGRRRRSAARGEGG